MKVLKKVKSRRFAFPFVAGLPVCILMLAFVLMPLPASGLTIRVYFDEFTGNSLEMYYTTDENPVMGPNQRYTATVDAQSNLAVIKLPPELADHVTQIRFDFPETEQVLSITDISVSSAGVIQHHYDPYDFFSENNILSKNSIPKIDLVESRQTAYIQTSDRDPYLVISSELLCDMLHYRSSYRKTRLVACILLALGYASYRMGLFDREKDVVRPSSY